MANCDDRITAHACAQHHANIYEVILSGTSPCGSISGSACDISLDWNSRSVQRLQVTMPAVALNVVRGATERLGPVRNGKSFSASGPPKLNARLRRKTRQTKRRTRGTPAEYALNCGDSTSDLMSIALVIHQDYPHVHT